MKKADRLGCCQVEAMVNVDARGQMVLPKEIRRRLGIRAGERLAVVTCGENDQSCCLVLMKANDLEGLVRGKLGPVMKSL